MKGKIGLVVGFVAGYVWGRGGGGERYEQIAARAKQVWGHPAIQSRVDSAKEFAGDRLAELPATVRDGAKDFFDRAIRGVNDSKKTAEPTVTDAAKSAKRGSASKGNQIWSSHNRAMK